MWETSEVLRCGMAFEMLVMAKIMVKALDFIDKFGTLEEFLQQLLPTEKIAVEVWRNEFKDATKDMINFDRS
jgi:hypothetical protein